MNELIQLSCLLGIIGLVGLGVCFLGAILERMGA
jgi:hypothetical protein